MTTIGYQRGDDPADADALAGVDKIYRDRPTLSPGGGRPGLIAAVRALRLGDALCVARLATFGLGTRALLTLSTELRHRGVHLVSVAEGVDTRTEDGWSFFRFTALLVAAEEELIHERAQLGLAAAARSCGKPRGRKGGGQRKLSPAQIERAREMLDDPNSTVWQVAHRFGVHRMTIYRRVLNSAA
jgi:DNA invertase Pin-like site-specific DNA recombinase